MTFRCFNCPLTCPSEFLFNNCDAYTKSSFDSGVTSQTSETKWTPQSCCLNPDKIEVAKATQLAVFTTTWFSKSCSDSHWSLTSEISKTMWLGRELCNSSLSSASVAIAQFSSLPLRFLKPRSDLIWSLTYTFQFFTLVFLLTVHQPTLLFFQDISLLYHLSFMVAKVNNEITAAVSCPMILTVQRLPW